MDPAFSPQPLTDFGLCAWRDTANGVRIFIDRGTAPGATAGLGVLSTRLLIRAKLFASVAEWDAFLEHLEADDAPTYHHLLAQGWQLAPVRGVVDYDALVVREGEPGPAPAVAEAGRAPWGYPRLKAYDLDASKHAPIAADL